MGAFIFKLKQQTYCKLTRWKQKVGQSINFFPLNFYLLRYNHLCTVFRKNQFCCELKKKNYSIYGL